jgi:hypothetical protein
VELDGAPQVTPLKLVPSARGTLDLPVVYGLLDGPHGMRIRYESRDGILHAGNWINPRDSVEWTVSVPRRGDYWIWLDHAVDAGQGGSEVEFIINGKETPRIAPNGMVFGTGGTEATGGAKRQLCKLRATGGRFQRKKAALVRLKKGENLIKVMVPTLGKERGMDLRGITLREFRNSR